MDKKRSNASEIWKRLRKNKMAMAGLAILLVLVFVAIFADVLADYDTKVIAQDLSKRLKGPSAENWLGTDEYGRDILARIIHGTRVSLIVGLVSVGISLLIGGVLGAVAGYYGGKVDNIIMRCMDVLLAIPSILMAITIVAAFGSSLVYVMLAIGVSGVPSYARIVRAAVLSVKDQEFVEASKSIGANTATIIFLEIIPNCMAPIIVQATLGVASAILSTSALSFIGLGVQPPDPEWGAILAGGRNYMRDAIHLTLFPGLAIIITILSLNLLGDGLRDALDPRLKQ
ncbi:peptide ABC transporter permease [Candidatus Epulonipiscium fishelsonii]|uniref:Peptide ABC transporter permease n=1 Tax=Candidatus Epulonipiscium fishelsonii TaxID=77094 RepID=A0ACC8XFF6_9FIRM|nr:peptide ABC transporter permease [Epulopiscium sp. SCG-B05WGA-EpuloA1]ONI42100.1 peptide ABC transporter permease [Epulopiscium sp. SCG-B11WGA-EpuloA1]